MYNFNEKLHFCKWHRSCCLSAWCNRTICIMARLKVIDHNYSR